MQNFKELLIIFYNTYSLQDLSDFIMEVSIINIAMNWRVMAVLLIVISSYIYMTKFKHVYVIILNKFLIITYIIVVSILLKNSDISLGWNIMFLIGNLAAISGGFIYWALLK